MKFEEYIEKYNIRLNGQQMEAVLRTDGPVLLLAVPGSGKTTVLISRIGYMIKCCGVRPEQILALTYTVAAAGDMQKRYRSIFTDANASGRREEQGTEKSAGYAAQYYPGSSNEQADGYFREYRGSAQAMPEFRTINGICAKIIGYYGELIGRRAFSLETDERQISRMLSEIYRETEKAFASESDLRSIRTLITYIKNMMLSESEIKALEEEHDFRLSEIYKQYQLKMRASGRMDYDDQMVYALRILRTSPETLEHFQKKYRYICVDEAQDTSKIQHFIIKMLSAGADGSDNLFMVGDEDQSIYGFRAAYPEALMNFKKDHPGAAVLMIEENFRSDRHIVEAADRFIQRNGQRYVKSMKASRAAEDRLRIIGVKNRKAQFSWLLKAAADITEETAVLYRDNESALPLVDMLEREGIPYRIRNAELGFFTSRVVMDIENILRFAYDPYDTELFMNIYYKLNLYMNRKAAEAACMYSQRERIPVLEAAAEYSGLPAYSVSNIRALITHFNNMKNENADKAIYRIVRYLGYGDYLKRLGFRENSIDVLRMIASNEKTPLRYLERMNELKAVIMEKKNDPDVKLVLSTIHSSKGLEYDQVYLIDTEDGIFPESVPDRLKDSTGYLARTMKPAEISGLFEDDEEQRLFEEERRLFYVGMTRAKNRLFIFSNENAESGSVFIRELVHGHAAEIDGGAAYAAGAVYAGGTGRNGGRMYGSGAAHSGRTAAYGAGASSADGRGNVLRRISGADGITYEDRKKTGYRFGVYGDVSDEGKYGTEKRKRESGEAGILHGKSAAAGIYHERELTQEGYEEFVGKLSEGLVVNHRKFGEGVIVSLDKEKAVILFNDKERSMLLKTLYSHDLLSI